MIEVKKEKKKMPIVLQAILIYLSSVILGLIVSSPLGKLYRYLTGPYTSTTVDVLTHEGLDNFLGGFIFGYLFFVGLSVGLFVKRKFWIVWLIGFILLGWMATWSWEMFGIVVLLSIIGFLLGRLILAVKNKFKK